MFGGSDALAGCILENNLIRIRLLELEVFRDCVRQSGRRTRSSLRLGPANIYADATSPSWTMATEAIMKEDILTEGNERCFAVLGDCISLQDENQLRCRCSLAHFPKVDVFLVHPQASKAWNDTYRP